MMFCSSTFAVCTSLMTTAAVQEVFVVDDDGGSGVDFVSICAAVEAAPSGSILLVRDGTYPGDILIDGKSLTLAADGDVTIVVEEGEFVIRNLSESDEVRLLGIDLEAAPMSLPLVPLLAIENNAGSVWVEGMDIPITTSNPFTGFETVRIENSLSVAFLDCTIETNPANVSPGKAGILAIDSNVFLAFCSVAGGAPFPSGARGGGGVEVVGSFLFAAHCSLTGGSGASGAFFLSCFGAGDGGPGILLQTPTANVHLYDTELIGGAGGTVVPPGPGCFPGEEGPASLLFGGSLTEQPLELRDLSVPALLRPGEPAVATFQGAAGDAAWLVYSTEPTGLFLPALSGSLLVSPPFAISFTGFLDASGTRDFPIRTPLLPAGLDGLVWLFQPLFLDTDGDFQLGSAASTVALTTGF